MTTQTHTTRTAASTVNAAIVASLLSFTLFAVTVAPPSQAFQQALTGKTAQAHLVQKEIKA